MSIVTINGSPRAGGCTATLMEQVVKGAVGENGQVKNFLPNEMNLKGCQSCMACQSTGKCNVEDDMTEVYEAIDAAEVLVLGTPIYFSEMTAQLKMVFDRFFPYMKENVAANKKCVLLTTQTFPDGSMYDAYIEGLKKMTQAIGFSEVIVFKASDVGNEHPEYLESCLALGKSLA